MEQPAALALLPNDVLADILTRLAPRDLAMALCVCRAWRAVIDGCRLLRTDLLPLSLGGIFINFNSHRFSEYFQSSGTPTISSMTDYLPHSKRDYWRYVEGHCNGLLLLCGDYVVNPATQWWAQMPLSSHTESKVFRYHNYLVFDPTLSSHYEVFSIPHFYKHVLMEESEWPPSSCILPVFSSRTGGWEERLFARDGEATTTISSMQKDTVPNSAVYYRRASYVHCQTNVVLRISLSDSKYRAIQPPVTNIKEILHLGKSKDGVYFASFGSIWNDLLRVWVLHESCGQMEWLLKCHVDLACARHENLGSWVLQDVNYNYRHNHLSNDKKGGHMDDTTEPHDDHGPLSILGFHPFEEVVFLSRSLSWGLAYHLNSSKLQYLGCLYPTEYEDVAQGGGEAILEAYPYTPCWM